MDERSEFQVPLNVGMYGESCIRNALFAIFCAYITGITSSSEIQKKIAEVTAAYEKVADRIAELEPETVIISSPHSIMYADYFHISPGNSASGDMGKFQAEEVSFDAEYDEELVEEICHIAENGGPDAASSSGKKRKGEKGLGDC